MTVAGLARARAAGNGAATAPAPGRWTDWTGDRRRNAGIVFGLLCVAAIGAYLLLDFLVGGRYVQETNDAYVRADMVTVSAKVGGYVSEVRVRDNQAVRRGLALAQIDPVDYINRVADADAQIAVASANRDAVAAQVEVARTGILQAEAALTVARRDLAYQREQERVYRGLTSTGAEPRQAYQRIVADRDKALAEIAGRQAAIQAARGQLAAAQAQFQQAAAQLQSAQIRRAVSRGDLDYSRVLAPIAGRVVLTGLRRGQLVQPGQRLLSIVPTQDIYLEANFKETQIGLMRPGQPVSIRIDALPSVRFRGYVESLTPGTGSNFSLIPPQNATGNFVKIVQRVPVRIFIMMGPEARKILVPGLSAHVEVDTRSARAEQEQLEREQDNAAR